MKKQAKGIIALSAVLVAMLGGGYAFLKLSPEEEKGGDGNKSTTMELLATQAVGQGTVLVSDNGKAADINTVEVKNSEGTLKVIMQEAATGEKGAVYTLEGYEDMNVDNTKVSTLVNNGNSIQAQSLIAEGCTDLGKYGLDKPAAEVEFTYKSGTKVKFYVGDTAPSGTVNYFMVDGKNDVYTVNNSTVANYQLGIKDFISKVILEKPADDETPIVKSLRIQRDDMEQDMLIEYDKSSEGKNTGGTSSSHKMVSPVESYLAIEKSTDITNGMFGLVASDIHVIGCNEKDIAESGLDKPFCTVTMDCDNGKSYKLLLGETFTNEEGKNSSYAMLDGGKLIYTVDADTAKWLTVQPIDIVSRLLITNYVWNITDLSVSGGGEKVDFIISPKNEENVPDSPTADDFFVRKDGKEFDTERYRKFYSFLCGSNAEEFAVGVPVPEGEPTATIKYTDKYNKTTTTYDFYDDTVMRSLIVVNGESKYYCTKSYVKTLIDNIKRIGTGEDYVTNW
ncbi:MULTISPECIES: DUF4340 domain-containing protein [Ruminococcus]|uniref:DUF4340 domain-containing protein n=1 Tax=Ruminococcus flavefaciens TaxID=1265 RepID=A0A1M7L6X5_RUMFL|nr:MULTISPECIES: DUF4340 domain-containing protein [Ruminococcus]MCR4796724.1 DUF4340 domain-containing protein [Ruminococcus sp.]SHM73883.1 protein of unknown function [Ruminococcus flavefaciens]